MDTQNNHIQSQNQNKKKVRLKVVRKLRTKEDQNQKATEPFINFGQLKQDYNDTHKCGTWFLKIWGILMQPFKLLKKTFIYRELEKLAEKNKDLVLLSKIIGASAAIGIIYYLYTWAVAGGLPNLDLNLLSNHLSTMSMNDLPMREAVDATMEAEALNCFSNYFNTGPYSLENAGIYDILRGALLLPILIIAGFAFAGFLGVYSIWVLITYWKDIIKAMWALVVMFVDYMKELILCMVLQFSINLPWPLPNITYHYDCPVFFGKFETWRKEYVDTVVARERLKYFQFYYLNKAKFYTRPKVKYIDQNLAKLGVNQDFAEKFSVRSRDVFYNNVLNGESTLRKQADRVRRLLPPVPDFASADEGDGDGVDGDGDVDGVDGDGDVDATTSKQIKQKAEKIYNTTTAITSLLTTLATLGLVGLFVFYSITGRPSWIYETIGPLWRSVTRGRVLKLLSSRYNYLALGGLTATVIGLFLYTRSGSPPLLFEPPAA